MAVQGLLDALNKLEKFSGSTPGEITISGTFLAPGFWAALAAFAWRRRISPDHIHLDEKLRGYFSAIGFARAFGHRDDYPHERRNKGASYSMLNTWIIQKQPTLQRPQSMDAYATHSAVIYRNHSWKCSVML